MRIFRRNDDDEYISSSLNNIAGRWDKVAVRRSQKAGILMEMGQDGQAREELEKAYEECLEVCTDTGNKYIESRVMSIFRTN